MLYYDRIIKCNLFHFHFSECISFTHLHLYQSIETNISLTSPKMPRVTTMTLCSITDYSIMDLLLALSFCLFVILKLHGIDKTGFVITIHDTMGKIYRLWNESFTHLLLIWYLNVKQTWKNKSQIHMLLIFQYIYFVWSRNKRDFLIPYWRCSPGHWQTAVVCKWFNQYNICPWYRGPGTVQSYLSWSAESFLPNSGLASEYTICSEPETGVCTALSNGEYTICSDRTRDLYHLPDP